MWINLLCTQHLKFVTWKFVFWITNSLLFNIQVKTKITFMYEWSPKSDAREGRTIKRIKEIMFLENGLYKVLRFSVFLSFISILEITFLPLENFLKFYIRQKTIDNDGFSWLRKTLYFEITRPYPPSGSPHCARCFPHFTCAKSVCGGGGAVSQTQKTQTVYEILP